MSDLEMEAPKVEEPKTKPKRTLNISDEERKRRSDRMKELAKKRTEVAQEKKSKIKEVKVEVKEEAKKVIEKKVKKIKQPVIREPESSDESESDDDSTLLSKPTKKKYVKKSTPNIIIKNYTSAPNPQPQPIPQVFQQQPLTRESSPPRQIGFFV
jgi:hypothetical protein